MVAQWPIVKLSQYRKLKSLHRRLSREKSQSSAENVQRVEMYSIGNIEVFNRWYFFRVSLYSKGITWRIMWRGWLTHLQSSSCYQMVCPFLWQCPLPPFTYCIGLSICRCTWMHHLDRERSFHWHSGRYWCLRQYHSNSARRCEDTDWPLHSCTHNLKVTSWYESSWLVSNIFRVDLTRSRKQ